MFPELKGIIRKFGQNVQGGLTTMRQTFNESLAVAQVEGEGDEMTRAGLRFSLGFAASITGIAPVQTVPSTAAQWLLWNPAANPATVYIDEIGMALVSGTAGIGAMLLGCKVNSQNGPSTVVTASSAHMLTANRGLQTTSTSQLVCVASQTLQAAPIPPLEFLAQQTFVSSTILGQALYNRDIRGKISIPPGTGYALFVTGAAGTTPLFAPVATYREYVALNQ